MRSCSRWVSTALRFAGAVALVLLPAPSYAQPALANAAGSRCFAADPSAGIMDIGAHYRFAQQQDSAALLNALRLRVRALFNCGELTGDDVLRAYSDVAIAVSGNVPNDACFGADARELIRDSSPDRQRAKPRSRAQWLADAELIVTREFNCLARARQPAFFASIAATLAHAAGNARTSTVAAAAAKPVPPPPAQAALQRQAPQPATQPAQAPASAVASVAPIGAAGVEINADLTGTWVGPEEDIVHGDVSYVLRPAGPNRWDGPVTQVEDWGICVGTCYRLTHVSVYVTAPGKLKLLFNQREEYVDEQTHRVTRTRENAHIWTVEATYTANEILYSGWKEPYRRRR